MIVLLPELLLLLFWALGVLLLWPREFDVESGMSSDGNSQPWHDFFELESGEKTAGVQENRRKARFIMIYS